MLYVKRILYLRYILWLYLPRLILYNHFLSQITNFVVTVCSIKVYILLFCLTCRTLHVDINRGVTEFDTHLSLYLSCIVVSVCIHHTCIEEEDTLFTKYGPTRGMNIHIYNYLKHNICLTKTKIQLHIHVIYMLSVVNMF